MTDARIFDQLLARLRRRHETGSGYTRMAEAWHRLCVAHLYQDKPLAREAALDIIACRRADSVRMGLLAHARELWPDARHVRAVKLPERDLNH